MDVANIKSSAFRVLGATARQGLWQSHFEGQGSYYPVPLSAVAFTRSNKSAFPSPQKIKHRHQWIPSRGNCIAMYTMRVFIILDQIKPPGIIFLMVCLSIWQHIAALDMYHTVILWRYPALRVQKILMLQKKNISNKSFWVNPSGAYVSVPSAWKTATAKTQLYISTLVM